MAQEFRQWRFTAGAVCDDVRGIRAVCRLLVLRVTRFGALVNPTVEIPFTCVPAIQRAVEPYLVDGIERRLDFIPLEARHMLLNSAAVALRINHFFTIAAEPRMARLRTSVLTAGKQIPADLVAAPAVLVVRLPA